jgi:hypothetical protein
MSIDIKNAFNSIRRRNIYDGLLQMFPQIAGFFKWVYGAPITLRGSDGLALGLAASGALQGDPLANLYFSVAFHPPLQRIQEALHDVEHAEADPTTRGIIVGIADDVSAQARTSVLFALAPMVTDILTSVDLTLNLSKSFIVGPHVYRTPNPPPGWILKEEGAKTLGRPLGSIQFQETWLQAHLAGRGPPILALRRLDPQCALMVLKLSYNHRPDYIRKVISKAVNLQAFLEFDEAVDKALQCIAGAQLHDNFRSVRELPIDTGGLGMPSATGIDAARHYLVTHQRTLLFLQLYYRNLLPVHAERFLNTEEDQYGLLWELQESTKTRLQMADDELSDTSILSFQSAAKDAANEMIKAKTQHLHEALASSPRTTAAAAQFLSSGTPNAAYWLRATSLPPYGAGNSFTSRDFVEMLRNRLLIAFVDPDTPGTNCTCFHRPPVDLSITPSHPLWCSNSSGIIIARHNAVRDRLATLLRKVLPAPGGVHVEPLRHNGVDFVRRPDIGYVDNGQSFYLDVVVAEPTAATAMSHPTTPSITYAGSAAELAEVRKRTEYAAANQGTDVQPFALESTGRLGATAKGLLNHICRDNAQDLKSFLFDTSYILASAKGRLLSTCRQRLAMRNNR